MIAFPIALSCLLFLPPHLRKHACFITICNYEWIPFLIPRAHPQPQPLFFSLPFSFAARISRQASQRLTAMRSPCLCSALGQHVLALLLDSSPRSNHGLCTLTQTEHSVMFYRLFLPSASVVSGCEQAPSSCDHRLVGCSSQKPRRCRLVCSVCQSHSPRCRIDAIFLFMCAQM